MLQADTKKVVEEPMQLLNSLIFSVLIESEKAKRYADLKIQVTKDQVI